MSVLRFHPEALREYVEAITWYETERDGLGAELSEEVERRLERARRAPGTGRCAANAPSRFDLRWYALRRFPYSLLIGLVNGERLVVAVAHERRRGWSASARAGTSEAQRLLSRVGGRHLAAASSANLGSQVCGTIEVRSRNGS